jgi:protein-S-isoprenylcysteine O-methyltransferase Ste14
MAAATIALVALIHDKTAFLYGASIAILGEFVQLWATSHLHKDTRFTISGPYSHVRNPMYFGRFFVGLGFFVMTWNVYLIVGYAVLYAVYGHLRVKREERRLSRIFAPHYEHYCAEVRRWLPRITPYSKSESRRAKWSRVCENHEQIVLLGLIVVLAAVYLRIDRLPDHFLHF